MIAEADKVEVSEGAEDTDVVKRIAEKPIQGTLF